MRIPMSERGGYARPELLPRVVGCTAMSTEVGSPPHPRLVLAATTLANASRRSALTTDRLHAQDGVATE
jgi:hypothetical protein